MCIPVYTYVHGYVFYRICTAVYLLANSMKIYLILYIYLLCVLDFRHVWQAINACDEFCFDFGLNACYFFHICDIFSVIQLKSVHHMYCAMQLTYPPSAFFCVASFIFCWECGCWLNTMWRLGLHSYFIFHWSAICCKWK